MNIPPTKIPMLIIAALGILWGRTVLGRPSRLVAFLQPALFSGQGHALRANVDLTEGSYWRPYLDDGAGLGHHGLALRTGPSEKFIEPAPASDPAMTFLLHGVGQRRGAAEVSRWHHSAHGT